MSEFVTFNGKSWQSGGLSSDGGEGPFRVFYMSYFVSCFEDFATEEDVQNFYRWHLDPMDTLRGIANGALECVINIETGEDITKRIDPDD